MNMDTLLIIFFLVFIFIIAIKHRSLDNFQFVLCIVILIELLYYFYSTSKCKETHETFVIGGSSYNHVIDLNLYNNKLFNLPSNVKDIILPKLDYVISKFKPNNDINESLYDSSKESLDETSYEMRKDPYVTKKDGNNTIIDPYKMNIMRQEYINIDDMLNDLQLKQPLLYKQLISDVNSVIYKKSLT